MEGCEFNGCGCDCGLETDTICFVSVVEVPASEAALYERVDREHVGTADDPIPYAPPMEIFAGKHYIQGGTVYRCTRDSGQALTHDLSALVGLYVEVV